MKSIAEKGSLDIRFECYGKRTIFEFGDFTLRSDIKLLALSHDHGLLFAGAPHMNKVKVFVIENLYNSEKSMASLLCRVLTLSSAPNVLECSEDGGTMLAISYSKACIGYLDIYECASFLQKTPTILYSLCLGEEQCVKTKQILWNPFLVKKVAVILNNGTVCIYTLQSSGGYIKDMRPSDSLGTEKIRCGCWSPSGNRIAFGTSDGKLQLLNLDLSESETITLPKNIHSKPYSLIAMHWLNESQFFVVLLQAGDDKAPAMFVIDVSHPGSIHYEAYDDVCSSSTEPRAQQFFFTHISEWDLLLVTSANGMEVGVLSRSLRDARRWTTCFIPSKFMIKLPIQASTEQKTYPVGLVCNRISMQRLIIDGRELRHMPMIHVLSTHGDLLSYHFINMSTNIMNICKPPRESIEFPASFKPFKATDKETDDDGDDEETSARGGKTIDRTQQTSDYSILM